MKKEIKFKNEKGQYCSTNQNNGFEVETDFCNIFVTRAGQQEPRYGNGVRAKVIVRSNGQRVAFDNMLFENSLNNIKWNADNETSYVLEKFFCNKRWSEVFKDAWNYISDELTKYEKLVSEREQALIDAEF